MYFEKRRGREGALVELGGDLLDVDVRVEGRRVALVAGDGADFALQCFDQLPNRHARRNRVRVHDQVRRDALLRRVTVTVTGLLPRECRLRSQR